MNMMIGIDGVIEDVTGAILRGVTNMSVMANRCRTNTTQETLSSNVVITLFFEMGIQIGKTMAKIWAMLDATAQSLTASGDTMSSCQTPQPPPPPSPPVVDRYVQFTA